MQQASRGAQGSQGAGLSLCLQPATVLPPCCPSSLDFCRGLDSSITFDFAQGG